MASRILEGGKGEEGLLFVISAPAGTGKTTLAQMLMREFATVVESVSCTTRPPRAGEIEGKDYHFMTHSAFEKMVEKGALLEHAEVFGQLYGTSRKEVEQQQKAGRHVLLVIDTQGARQLKGKIEATFIFLLPPSLEALRERLIRRSTESPEAIEKRLAWAGKEMQMAQEYDYIIVNDDLQVAYQVLRSIVIAEEHKVRG